MRGLIQALTIPNVAEAFEVNVEQVVEVHALAKGLVQGVGFRATARNLAQKHAIKGTVRNLADGTVEIYAQGNKHALDKFFATLLEDFGDYIHNFEQTPGDLKEYDGFHILR